MGCHPALSQRLLPTGNTFKDGHALLHELISLNIQEIGAWQAMLGNENWLFIPLNI